MADDNYICIEGQSIKKDWNKLREKNDERFSDDKENNEEEQSLLIDNLILDEVRFDEKEQTLSVCIGSDYGFGFLEIPISDDLIFEMINHLRLKGEKIKRLVNLTEGE
ncbi:MAG: hypothetical protein WC346_04565 [Methanogenium sp.]|jgi:hypothetical protein